MVRVRVSRAFKGNVHEDEIINAAEKTFKHQGFDPGDVDLSIVIENDKKLKELNRRFLGIDAVTDVLSFSLNEKDPENETLYLGDVIISYQRALEQSAQVGYPVMHELELLTVHGVLHLLGYDHVEPAEKTKMWSLQREILESLNIIARIWPEE